MYSQEEIIASLKVYHQYESLTRTITTLGYPTRRALYIWIKEDNLQKPPRKELSNINTVNHPRNPSHEVKMSAIHRCFELGESIKLVSEKLVIINICKNGILILTKIKEKIPRLNRKNL